MRLGKGRQGKPVDDPSLASLKRQLAELAARVDRLETRGARAGDEAPSSWSAQRLEALEAAMNARQALGRDLAEQVGGRDPELEADVTVALMAVPRKQWDGQPPAPEVYVSLSRNLSPVAARLFEQHAVASEEEELAIGISGGTTIAGMMEAVTASYDGNLWLVPMTAPRAFPGAAVTGAAVSVNTVIGRFCGQPGRCEVNGLQTLLDPRARREMDDDTYDRYFGSLMRSYYIRNPSRDRDSAPPAVTFVFTGLGSFDRERNSLLRHLSAARVAPPHGMVGDLLGWPYDEQGSIVADDALCRIIVGVRPDALQEGRVRGNLRKVIVVAGARDATVSKEKAIVSAWRGGFFDVLVTDACTARLILSSVR